MSKTITELLNEIKKEKCFTMKLISENSGKDYVSTTQAFKSKNMRLKTLLQLFEGMDEPLVILTSDGNKHEIKNNFND